MTMTVTQSVITIAAVVLGTMTTRFLPFLVFPEGREPPAFIVTSAPSPYCGHRALLVYCLKDAVFASVPRTAGADRHRRDRRAATVEKEHAFEPVRRHSALYAARADLLCVKNEAMLPALSHFFFCSSILAPAQSRKTPNGLRNTVMVDRGRRPRRGKRRERPERDRRAHHLAVEIAVFPVLKERHSRPSGRK